MELRGTWGLRPGGQAARGTAGQADAASRAAAQPARKDASADKLTLSRQALAFLEEQRREAWEKKQEQLQRKLDESNQLIQDMENAQEQAEAMSESMEVMIKCLKIAASIMNGDNVPAEDMQYLMEHDPDTFSMAVSLRRQKDDPEDCDSILDDEDREASAQESGGGEASSVSAAEAPSGEGPDTTAAE